MGSSWVGHVDQKLYLCILRLSWAKQSSSYNHLFVFFSYRYVQAFAGQGIVVRQSILTDPLRRSWYFVHTPQKNHQNVKMNSNISSNQCSKP